MPKSGGLVRLCKVCRTCGVVAAVVIAAHASATMQAPTFKVASKTVAVYATVTSADGRMVPDLPRSAFTILDNGKPQPLTVFSNDQQPITVVMLLDRSGSMRANFSLVEKAAEQFVTAMLPTDKARIGSFANGVAVSPPDFASDHDRLLRILRSDLQPEGPTPLWNAVNVGISALVRERGRRVILVFTDGADSPGNLSSDNASLKDVMTRAEEQDVMVYAIGLEGRNVTAFGGPGGRLTKPDGGLLKIATATGGGYFELTSTDDLAGTFSRVADELHHQYALGFTPTTLDGKRHTLDVQVAGTGLTVRSRKSYLAVNEAALPPAAAERAVSGADLENALAPLATPPSGRAIRTWVGMSRAEQGRTTVTLVWAAAPKVPGAAAEVETPARVSIVATGASETEYFNGVVPDPDATTGAAAGPIARFDAPPGPLRVRLSIQDSSSRVISSESRTITVTDFAPQRPLLGTPQILRGRTLPEYQRMKADPDAVPAVTREFTRTDRLMVRLPAYGLEPGGAVVGIRLLNQAGFVIRDLAAVPVEEDRRRMQQADVPVANLPPGQYVIQVRIIGDGDELPSELVAFRLSS